MEDILYKEIGKNIKKARLLKNLTQQELSDFINITRASIANIERGNQKITFLTLYQIADSLDISPKLLIPEIKEIKKTQNELYMNLDNLRDKLSLKELEWVYQIKRKSEMEEGEFNENKEKD
jgi:transcriptional regulator with XRE-family HTH domain